VVAFHVAAEVIAHPIPASAKRLGPGRRYLGHTAISLIGIIMPLQSSNLRLEIILWT
jgi:hypothetical protein